MPSFTVGVGADAEIGETRQMSFAQPFMQGLAQQRKRGQQNQNVFGFQSFRDPKCHERFTRAASHDGGNAVVCL